MKIRWREDNGGWYAEPNGVFGYATWVRFEEGTYKWWVKVRGTRAVVSGEEDACHDAFRYVNDTIRVLEVGLSSLLDRPKSIYVVDLEKSEQASD